jgi:hypothetical protein
MSLAAGEQGMTAGVGTYDGRSAFGFRYQGQPTSKFSVGLGFGVSDTGMVAGSAGVGVKF